MARYTDHDIELVLRMRGEGFSYGKIAAIMDMPKSTVHAIATGKQRGIVPDHWEVR
jgi:DNA-directed RNA polymerase specialized sigma24 family protein